MTLEDSLVYTATVTVKQQSTESVFQDNVALYTYCIRVGLLNIIVTTAKKNIGYNL